MQLHLLPNVGVKGHEPVLVHLEYGQLGEGPNAIREAFNEVL